MRLSSHLFASSVKEACEELLWHIFAHAGAGRCFLIKEIQVMKRMPWVQRVGTCQVQTPAHILFTPLVASASDSTKCHRWGVFGQVGGSREQMWISRYCQLLIIHHLGCAAAT